MIALAAQQQWHMISVDVKTAFLYGELDEELFMEQPEGFIVKGQEHKVFHLKHAVTVRSPCLSVILVLEFSDRGISQIGSRPDISIRKVS